MSKQSTLLAGLFVLLASVSAAEEAAVDIPYCGTLRIDAQDDDWGGRPGLVGLMVDKNGGMSSPSDFDSQFRLGWNEQGLCLFLRVRDDVRETSADATAPFERDSVEVFVMPKKGAKEMYHAAILPGTPGDALPFRVRFFGPRTSAPARAYSVSAACANLDGGGYTAEALLPWSNLDLSPKTGDELGVQVFVNDADGTPSRFQAVWYPRTRTHEDTTAAHRVRLGAPDAGKDVFSSVRAQYDDLGRLTVSVAAVEALAGKEAVVKQADRTLASAPLQAEGGRAAYRFHLPMPAPGQQYDRLGVWVDGVVVAEPELANADEARARALMTMDLVFKPYVFRDARFPSCEFANPLAAQNLLGPYTVRVRYFDKNYNEVDAAEQPGRYGAVIDIVPEQGRPLRRFRTLFRAPETFQGFRWALTPNEATLDMPEGLGIDPKAAEYQAGSISRYLYRLLEGAMAEDATAAVVLAGLAETEPKDGAATTADNLRARDRQWWVGLKRKLYGTESALKFECPRPVDGAPAPTVREGTAEEAGMDPAVIDKLDKLCRDWAEASDEPFATCLVRNGVAFFHRAYGDYHGRPMDTQTKTWMASISKFLGGLQMMMLVDQGLANIDDRVDQYVAPLRGIDVPKPLTIRHLYTHTNGLLLGIQPRSYYNDHWGDDFNDFEEIVAGYYPYLKVGEKHGYNGAGYALAGKIIEQLTGEAQPVYARKHLLDPLGCDHTDIVDMSAYTQSVPMDMARIGQMVLNKGAYGDQRFFSPETLEKMMPVKLDAILGPDTEVVWGIGAVYMPPPGLSPKTFGHGAASAANFLIDPDNQLVMVMTRDQMGPRYWEFNDRFFKIIAEGLPKEEAKTP